MSGTGSSLMGAKESYLSKLERIGKEYEAKVTPEEWVQSRLRWEDWNTLLPELVQFAKQEIRRRRWRGRRAEVLPEGYDANSVAAEAIAAALRGEARLAPGWTRERLMNELQRKVSNEVRRLHKLTEAKAMRSEWNILAPGANEQLRSVFDRMRGRFMGRLDEEQFQAQDRLRKEAELLIAEKLHGEDEMVEKLFTCLREGTVKRREIAMKLGMNVTEVTNCRRRLNRKLEELGKTEPGCPEWVIEEWKAK